MWGYTEQDLKDIISGLCGIEASGDDVAAIERALDFLEEIKSDECFD